MERPNAHFKYADLRYLFIGYIKNGVGAPSADHFEDVVRMQHNLRVHRGDRSMLLAWKVIDAHLVRHATMTVREVLREVSKVLLLDEA